MRLEYAGRMRELLPLAPVNQGRNSKSTRRWSAGHPGGSAAGDEC